MTGKEIAGVPVVADLNNASSFICQQWVDEVFVNVDETYPYPQELIEELLEMGMPVHVNLAKVRSTPGQKQFVEAIGGYTVLTTTMNYATDRQALAKRVLDILGGRGGLLPDRNHFYFHSTGYLHQFSGSDFLLTDKDWKKRKAI